jgi:hypothetical protein
MIKSSRRFEAVVRGVAAAAALAPLLVGCAERGDLDAMSGSSQPTPIVSSTTADYGDYGVREPGTNWGRVDGYHTECGGSCRTLAGGS